ncbi:MULTISPECIES: glycosyltransferase family 4 protein [unclassified Aeromicrobium]|uniref:glycosyltransferase family 4 protein n=1 Tax=unclassified Aeromicrobium TaxID=2633570 RepID=UPI0028891853|nr:MULTISPECIES: glycosyltransferase family 4 protein [unclassified Aeromicrobium]
MRVALLSYRSKQHVGGQGVYVEHLSRGLVEAGHDVEVISGQPYPEGLDPRVRLTRLPSLGIYDEPDPFKPPAPWTLRSVPDVVEWLLSVTGAFGEPLSFTLRADRHLRDRLDDFDVVHDNQSLGWGLLALRRRLPLVVTIHHPISRDRIVELEAARGWRKLSVARWYSFVGMQARVARRLPFVVGVSTVATDDTVTDFGIDPARIRVVPLGVDTETFGPVRRPQPGTPADAAAAAESRVPGRIVAVASADKPLKGVAHLLDALAKVRVEHPDVELQLVSSVEPGGATDRRIDALDLRDCVTTHSGLESEQIAELLRSAEIMCVPSLYEGFSLPTVEALASGTAVVASRAGAIPEVVGDAEGGEPCAVLVEPGDAEQLAAAVSSLLDDPDRRAALGAAGRARALERYSWTSVAKATADVYDEAIRRFAGKEQ